MSKSRLSTTNKNSLNFEIDAIKYLLNDNFNDYGPVTNSVDFNMEKKPFTCNDCGKTFKYKCHFANHSRIHNKVKSYICPICKMKFTTQEHLHKHKILHKYKKPLTCDICCCSFKTNDALRTHEIIHNDAVSHKCNRCGQHFRFKTALDEHEKVHFNLSVLVCSLCDMTFKTRKNLNRHVMVSHGQEKQFKCSVCNEAFKCRNTWKNHVLNHTVGKSPTSGEFHADNSSEVTISFPLSQPTDHLIKKLNNSSNDVFPCTLKEPVVQLFKLDLDVKDKIYLPEITRKKEVYSPLCEQSMHYNTKRECDVSTSSEDIICSPSHESEFQQHSVELDIQDKPHITHKEIKIFSQPNINNHTEKFNANTSSEVAVSSLLNEPGVQHHTIFDLDMQTQISWPNATHKEFSADINSEFVFSSPSDEPEIQEHPKEYLNMEDKIYLSHDVINKENADTPSYEQSVSNHTNAHTFKNSASEIENFSLENELEIQHSKINLCMESKVFESYAIDSETPSSPLNLSLKPKETLSTLELQCIVPPLYSGTTEIEVSTSLQYSDIQRKELIESLEVPPKINSEVQTELFTPVFAYDLSKEEISECEVVGKIVAVKLKKMNNLQSFIADKLINDILFRGLVNELSESTHIANL